MPILSTIAGVTGALNAVGNLVGNLVNYGSDRTNNERQRQLMYEANRLQRENINAQNAYNSPAAQISRLESAGLNPALMYGNGSGDTGLQSSVPSVDTPNFVAPKVGSTDITGAMTPLVNAELAKANIEKTNAETEEILSRIPGTGADSEYKVRSLDSRLQNLELTNQSIEISNDLGRINQGVQSKYRELLESRKVLTDWQQKELEYKVTNLLPQEREEILSRISLNQGKVAEMCAQIRYLSEQVSQVIPAMAAYYSESAGKEHSFSALLDREGEFKEFYNENVMHFLPESVRASIDETIARINKLGAETNLTEKEGKVVFWNTAFKGLGTIFDGVDSFTRAYSAIVTGGASTVAETITRDIISPYGIKTGSTTTTRTHKE